MREAEYCSFCGKHKAEVAKLVLGPGVGICNECHDLMRGIIPVSPDSTPEERAARQRDFDEWLARDLAAREERS